MRTKSIKTTAGTPPATPEPRRSSRTHVTTKRYSSDDFLASRRVQELMSAASPITRRKQTLRVKQEPAMEPRSTTARDTSQIKTEPVNEGCSTPRGRVPRVKKEAVSEVRPTPRRGAPRVKKEAVSDVRPTPRRGAPRVKKEAVSDVRPTPRRGAPRVKKEPTVEKKTPLKAAGKNKLNGSAKYEKPAEATEEISSTESSSDGSSTSESRQPKLGKTVAPTRVRRARGHTPKIEDEEDDNKPKRGRGRPKGSRKSTARKRSTRRRSKPQQEEVTLIDIDETLDASLPSQNFDFDVDNTGMFMDEWIMLEKMSTMPHPTPVYRVINKHGVFGDLRFYSRKDLPAMNMEAQCLDKMEKSHKSTMFRKIYEVRTIDSEAEGLTGYMITFHKPGVPLNEIIVDKGSLDVASGTRFSMEMIEIVECLAKGKLVMTDIHAGMFSVDQYSCKLFLSDASKVIGNFDRFNLANDFKCPIWTGTSLYAPYKWHQDPNSPMCEGDLVESAFYVYLDMIGKLPWSKIPEPTMIETKQRWADAELNLMIGSELPAPLIPCWFAIRRGQMIDICRSKSMSNGTVLLHQYRQQGIKNKTVPTCAMMDYGIIYAGMRNYATEGTNNVVLPLPTYLQNEPTLPELPAIMHEIFDLKLEREALNMDCQTLRRMKTNMDIHTKQLDVEVDRNERFIQKYVFDNDMKKDGDKVDEELDPDTQDPADINGEEATEVEEKV